MAGFQTQKNLTTGSPVQKIISGWFEGINGASPTNYDVDPGVSVARTGEGVWDVTLPSPIAGIKAVYVKATDDDGNYHKVDFTTTISGNTRKITITHMEAPHSALGQTIAVSAELTDVSAPSSAYVASPVAGLVTGMRTVLHSAITGADATILGKINGVNMGSSSLTVAQSGSAAGDRDASTPNSSNTVAIGDALEVNTDGASSTTARLTCTFMITPLAANVLQVQDIVDRIDFMVLVEESDCIGSGI